MIAKYVGKKRKNTKFLTHENKKRIFYMMVPTHGNLGDQAIAEATYKLLKKEFADYEVITTYDEDVYKDISLIKKL